MIVESFQTLTPEAMIDLILLSVSAPIFLARTWRVVAAIPATASRPFAQPSISSRRLGLGLGFVG